MFFILGFMILFLPIVLFFPTKILHKENLPKMEKNVNYEQLDKGDYVEVRITLPKKDRCFT